jgi:DNA polymerase-3 subunit alpha
MEIFKRLGGYTLGQADMVRRAMGKKKVSEMAKQKKIFAAGAAKNGVPKDVAANIFAKMEKFAGYAFNKSHAACYAFLAYQTAYLKYYYYSFFMASMLNNRINKWDDMTHYVAEMRAKDAVILPPDINKSEAAFTVDIDGKNYPVRFGLSAIKNVGEGLVNQMIEERNENGEYKSFIDFCKRVPSEVLNKRCLESLILSGCFDCFGLYRSQLMSIYPAVVKVIVNDKRATENGQMSLFSTEAADAKIDVSIPALSEFDNFSKLQFEKEFVGLYLSGHPLQEYAHLFVDFNFNIGNMPHKKEDDDIGEEDEESDEDIIKDGTQVTVGAIITAVKKIYTRANHDEMAVLTVEDLFGSCEVMVFHKIWEGIKGQVAKDSIVKVTGKLSFRKGETPIILADGIEQIKMGKTGFSEEEATVKKLYLRFNLQDENVKNDVMTVLSSYSGDMSVVIKDSATGKACSPQMTIRECKAIVYELKNILGEENVVLK